MTTDGLVVANLMDLGSHQLLYILSTTARLKYSKLAFEQFAQNSLYQYFGQSRLAFFPSNMAVIFFPEQFAFSAGFALRDKNISRFH